MIDFNAESFLNGLLGDLSGYFSNLVDNDQVIGLAISIGVFIVLVFMALRFTFISNLLALAVALATGYTLMTNPEFFPTTDVFLIFVVLGVVWSYLTYWSVKKDKEKKKNYVFLGKMFGGSFVTIWGAIIGYAALAFYLPDYLAEHNNADNTYPIMIAVLVLINIAILLKTMSNTLSSSPKSQ